MKGCLAFVGVVALLLFLLVGGGIGYGCVKGKELQDRAQQGKAQLDQIDAKYPFAPTAADRLESARFSQMLAVRRSLATTSKQTFEGLQRIGEKKDASAWEVMKGLFSGVGGIISLIFDAPAQLAAQLEPAKMSFKEYRWITARMHGTLLTAARQGDADATAINEALEKSLDHTNQRQAQHNHLDQIHADLEASHPTVDPQDLALIVAKKDELDPDGFGYLIDIFVLSDFDQGGVAK